MSKLYPDPGLDRLVEDLNRSAPAAQDPEGPEPAASPAAGAGGGTPERPRLVRRPPVEPGDSLEELLLEMVRAEASDLLLVAGEPPVVRLDGQLKKTSRETVDADDLRSLFLPYLDEALRSTLERRGSADLSLRLGERSAVDERWRFRVNLHRQRGTLAAAVRALPRRIPTLEELNLPASLAELVRPTRGLVLVCGPTGAGKTSTLAALVGEINRARTAHVITIEDPVEYLHENRRSIVEQLEVGADTPSFADALWACLRQDPDVILVGEMRDLETVAAALTAAETGHLVLSTLHTHDVAQAVHRIVDVFPAAQQAQIRHQLALSLSAVVCQQLLPRSDGRRGRVPAVEVLKVNHAVRNHIRRENTQSLATEITLGRRQGMIALEASLADLVSAGVVSYEDAFARSSRPDELESLLQRGGNGSSG